MIKINSLYSLDNVLDCYVVDEFGNIINSITGKMKKFSLSKRGYYYVSLSLKNSKKQLKVYVHKIIALAFIKNNKYEVINHIDGNKLNNSINNLEFCSQKKNINHAWNTKLITRKEKIFTVTFLNSKNEISGTIKELANIIKIPKGTLYDLYYKKKGSIKYQIKYIK